MNSATENEMLIVGVAARPAAGQSVSGDAHFVETFPNGALIAVMDGVGHGYEATTAAQAATEVLKHSGHAPTTEILKRCHDTLATTRGAVMTVAQLDFSANKLEWLGVGNVDGRLFRARRLGDSGVENVLAHPGVLGHQLPVLRPKFTSIESGDLLVFATDGIHPGYENINEAEAPQRLAEHILRHNFKGGDDALVLVVRYLGWR
jgi:negative regulator of sigma-B (phosphoserine phosphatase)